MSGPLRQEQPQNKRSRLHMSGEGKQERKENSRHGSSLKSALTLLRHRHYFREGPVWQGEGRRLARIDYTSPPPPESSRAKE
jgi:hypothetical protein